MRRLLVVLVAALAGCLPPPEQLAPARLHVAASPAAVVQRFAAIVVPEGFEIVASDADAGVVTARRARASHGNSGLITCKFANGSILDTHHRSTLTLSLAARAASDSTEVTLNTVVLSEYPSLTGFLSAAPSESDCASLGVIEKKVTAALR